MPRNVRSSNVSSNQLNGMMLYHEPKRTVYYDIFSKKGYIINNAEAREYLLYSTRYSGMGLLGFFIFYATNNLVVSLVCAVVGLVLLEVLFRFKFLYKLPSINNYKRPKKAGYVAETAERDSYFKIILLIVCGILFALMIGSYMSNGLYDTTLTTILAYALVYGSLFISMLNVLALFKKIKNRN